MSTPKLYLPITIAFDQCCFEIETSDPEATKEYFHQMLQGKTIQAKQTKRGILLLPNKPRTPKTT